MFCPTPCRPTRNAEKWIRASTNHGAATSWHGVSWYPHIWEFFQPCILCYLIWMFEEFEIWDLSSCRPNFDVFNRHLKRLDGDACLSRIKNLNGLKCQREPSSRFTYFTPPFDMTFSISILIQPINVFFQTRERNSIQYRIIAEDVFLKQVKDQLHPVKTSSHNANNHQRYKIFRLEDVLDFLLSL